MNTKPTMFPDLISPSGGYFVAVFHEVGHLWGVLDGWLVLGWFFCLFVLFVGLGFFLREWERCSALLQPKVCELLTSPFS